MISTLLQRPHIVLFALCISSIVWVQWQSLRNTGLERKIRLFHAIEQEGVSTIPAMDRIRTLPQCNATSKADWIECETDDGDSVSVTVDVVLGVYRRNNVVAQLEMIAKQTLLPQTIFIIQNEDHVGDIQAVVKEWNSKNSSSTTRTSSFSPLNISWIHFSQDSGYHGRFHIAYFMSKARYVSIWDDDLTVGQGWLAYVVNFLEADRLRRHHAHHDEGGMIVSSRGRVLRQLPNAANDWNVEYGSQKTFRPRVKRDGQRLRAHRVDFTVQHHTTQRTLLRHYLGAPVLTYFTGEDMQLSFALQRVGVQAYAIIPPSKRITATASTPEIYPKTAWASANTGMGANGEFASWKTKAQEPRLWLLCQLVLEGFQFDDCLNCDNSTAHTCVHHFESTGATMRHKGETKP